MPGTKTTAARAARGADEASASASATQDSCATSDGCARARRIATSSRDEKERISQEEGDSASVRLGNGQWDGDDTAEDEEPPRRRQTGSDMIDASDWVNGARNELGF